MKRIDLKSLALGVLLGAAAVLSIAAVHNSSGQLEFHVVAGAIFEGSFERNLNKAAATGWKFEQTATFTDRYGYAVMSRPKL